MFIVRRIAIDVLCFIEFTISFRYYVDRTTYQITSGKYHFKYTARGGIILYPDTGLVFIQNFLYNI